MQASSSNKNGDDAEQDALSDLIQKLNEPHDKLGRDLLCSSIQQILSKSSKYSVETQSGIELKDGQLHFGVFETDSSTNSSPTKPKTITLKNNYKSEVNINAIAIIPSTNIFSLSKTPHPPPGLHAKTLLQGKSSIDISVSCSIPTTIGTHSGWLLVVCTRRNDAMPTKPIIFAKPLLVVLRGERFECDPYAPSFVPKHMKALNKLPAYDVWGTPLASPNFLLYQSTWTPALLPPRAESFHTPDQSAINNMPLSIPNYTKSYWDLLWTEINERTKEMDLYAIYETKINVGPNKVSPEYYEVSVPGLTQSAPHLMPGDLVVVRKYSNFDQMQYCFFIQAALRAKSAIIFKPIPNIPWFETESETYNIQFRPASEMLRWAGRSLLMIDNQSQIHSNIADQFRKWLMPEPSDGIRKEGRLGSPLRLPLYNPQLNFEQQKAIQAVVEGNYGSVPYVIWGPPGTGKTATITEAIIQIVNGNPSTRILACAPSGSAADTIATRLAKYLTLAQMFRLNSPHRGEAEVPDTLRMYCHSENGFFSLPPFAKLIQHRVIVCTCHEAGLLVNAGITNFRLSEVSYLYNYYGNQSFPHLHPLELLKLNTHFSHLFIDEAAQATEPETLISLSVVSPYYPPILPTGASPTFKLEPARPAKIVLCGDHCQLGPLLKSDEAKPKLGISWLERLMNLDFYKRHPNARQQRHVSASPLSDSSRIDLSNSPDMSLQDVVPPFANLIRNYRSHPTQLMVPSYLFYGDTLEPCGNKKVIEMFLDHPILPNKQVPIVFYGIEDNDTGDIEGWNWYNEAELGQLVKTVKRLVFGEDGLSPEVHVGPTDIGVISPFREQVRRIRQALRQEKLRDVNVGTVEDYQGKEFKVILISTVRSQHRFLSGDVDRDIGLVHFRKRLNVAITRAMALLVVIGNPHLLGYDVNWTSFMSFVYRHGCFEGCLPPLRVLSFSRDTEISRLEKAWLHFHSLQKSNPKEWLGSGGMGVAELNKKFIGLDFDEHAVYDHQVEQGEDEEEEEEDDGIEVEIGSDDASTVSIEISD
ncbi:hypothetical protein SmJEL517_g04446 [Synchytrium microbalum]|uniref:Uncharacterized protein n=1 Tax=Synchytrium microbalum TaxID=1806994 RepID=A0A507C4F5_9FUNG|nr:uncharacterized protein SmJEL517_g04446 [Synchytrium microbalum]TPX32413.1 hypothetical protein SmJEL517_g04446 [Synchytrium microbalum]